MSPSPKVGYGGTKIPDDEPPSSNPTETLLRQAVKELQRAAERYDNGNRGLELRMGVVEGRCTGMEAKLANQGQEITETLLLVKTIKSVFNNLSSKAIVIVCGTLAGSWGLNKATAEKPPAPQVIYQKSSLDHLVEVCKAEPDYPPNNLGLTPRTACAVRVAQESFGPTR